MISPKIIRKYNKEEKIRFYINKAFNADAYVCDIKAKQNEITSNLFVYALLCWNMRYTEKIKGIIINEDDKNKINKLIPDVFYEFEVLEYYNTNYITNDLVPNDLFLPNKVMLDHDHNDEKFCILYSENEALFLSF